MRKSAAIIVMLLVLPLMLTGCLPLIVGGAVGAMGGYVISKDSVQGDTDIAYDALWHAAVTVCQERGAVMKSEDSIKGYLEAFDSPNRIWVRMFRLTRTATRIRVSARKLHMPNLSLAQDLCQDHGGGKVIEGTQR